MRGCRPVVIEDDTAYIDAFDAVNRVILQTDRLERLEPSKNCVSARLVDVDGSKLESARVTRGL